MQNGPASARKQSCKFSAPLSAHLRPLPRPPALALGGVLSLCSPGWMAPSRLPATMAAYTSAAGAAAVCLSARLPGSPRYPRARMQCQQPAPLSHVSPCACQHALQAAVSPTDPTCPFNNQASPVAAEGWSTAGAPAPQSAGRRARAAPAPGRWRSCTPRPRLPSRCALPAALHWPPGRGPTKSKSR